MQTNTATKDSNVSDHSLDIRSQAKMIIDGIISPEVDTSIVQGRVEKALGGDSNEAIKLMNEGNFDLFQHLPESMRHDIKIVNSALKKNPKLYHTLSPHIKSNIEVKKSVIESYIRVGGSIIEILRIQDLDEKTSAELGDYTVSMYKKYKNNFPDEYSRLLYNIYKANRDVYKMIISAGIFVTSESGIKLGPKLSEYLSTNSEILEQESPEKVQEKIVSLIKEFLGLQNTQLEENVLELLQSMAQSIQIVKKKEKNKKQEEIDDPSEAEMIDDVDEDPEEYSSGPYNYLPLGNSFQVSDTQGRDVKIEKKDFESMNEKSLHNYMNFHLKMKNLGMSFLLEKYSSKIQIATGIDFYAGEGMSDARILMFLNKVGKVLGMPQSSYEDPDGNRKILCFHTVAAAYLAFREMKESYIGKHSAVYDSMKEKGIINPQSGEFSIFAFHDASLAKI